MKQDPEVLLHRTRVFAWIALATGAISLIPLIAMQITTDVAWNPADVFVMGSLHFGMASLFVLVARKLQRKHRLSVSAMFVAVFLYAWAELGVGVFTSLTS